MLVIRNQKYFPYNQHLFDWFWLVVHFLIDSDWSFLSIKGCSQLHFIQLVVTATNWRATRSDSRSYLRCTLSSYWQVRRLVWRINWFTHLISISKSVLKSICTGQQLRLIMKIQRPVQKACDYHERFILVTSINTTTRNRQFLSTRSYRARRF